jgi:hypothetical protein
MTINVSTLPDVEQVLAELKDFQRDTVAYVYRRLYQDPDPVSRFLIADEVGLGKTLVARGVIAMAIDRLWDCVDRIDVLYICSNQAIARQNIDRLNITADRRFQFASRATLLPITLEQLKGNKLNFVSFTPGTSFDLKSRAGQARERVVLYYLLREAWDVPDGPLRNVLRGNVYKRNWRWHLDQFGQEKSIDDELKESFFTELAGHPALRARCESLSSAIGSRRKHIPQELRCERDAWIGELRHMLARSSLSALEPDLVILDEFQRFKYLLDEESEIGLLVGEIFNFEDAKVLLLSATPYKMYTLQAEEDEDHYADFYLTVKFLLNGQPSPLATLEAAIQRYRRAMLRIQGDGLGELKAAKATIEEVLRQVMVRTERLAASADRNGMLAEARTARDQITATDLAGFVRLDEIARVLEAGDQVEYWKSSAYVLNMMEDYTLKRRFEAALQGPQSVALAAALEAAQSHLLDWRSIQAYQEIDPGNARLRALWEDNLESDNWQLLWMPPTLPYYHPSGPFAKITSEGRTKTLVFSAWRIVPKVISILTSYEAERRMLDQSPRDFEYAELTRQRRPLLRFAYSKERLTGMPIFCLVYPCLTLAQLVDPLTLAHKLADGDIPSAEMVSEAAKARISRLLEEATASVREVDAGQPDESWYWAALALLDRHFHRDAVSRWLDTEQEELAWDRMLGANPDEEDESRYAEHVHRFAHFFGTPEGLGRRPPDLIEVLTHVALAGPAVASLRALLRQTQPDAPEDWTQFLASAARAGLGFYALFNQPDAISLLQGLYPEDVYWQAVLRYCLAGNLQAVVDEYLHVLHESLGLVGHNPAESAAKMGKALQEAASIRPQVPQFDELLLGEGEDRVTLAKRTIRCRYAMRFGDERSDDKERFTRETVQLAFNSPFRPFMLATTSIGQEGLDFHQYCHRVVHWNLPSNPVDLEQREGRVHRYKGHVIRRNLALRHGLDAVDPGQGTLVDPWAQLFAQARQERPEGANDLEPFWIYEVEGGFKIERQVPMLPLSRELGRIEQLKRSLVAYRSVIGQPRQQELLEFLSARLPAEELERLVDEFAIDLSPPREKAV